MLAELAHPDAVVFPTTVAVYREVEEVDGVLVDSPHPGLLLDGDGEDDDDDDADAENDAGAARTVADAGESTWWEDVWDGHEEGIRSKHPAGPARALLLRTEPLRRVQNAWIPPEAAAAPREGHREVRGGAPPRVRAHAPAAAHRSVGECGRRGRRRV